MNHLYSPSGKRRVWQDGRDVATVAWAQNLAPTPVRKVEKVKKKKLNILAH